MRHGRDISEPHHRPWGNLDPCPTMYRTAPMPQCCLRRAFQETQSRQLGIIRTWEGRSKMKPRIYIRVMVTLSNLNMRDVWRDTIDDNQFAGASITIVHTHTHPDCQRAPRDEPPLRQRSGQHVDQAETALAQLLHSRGTQTHTHIMVLL